jgi:hypothetical protein
MARQLARRFRLYKEPLPSIDASDVKSTSEYSATPSLSFTIEGFGLLSGKAIHAFEKLASRTADNVAIHRRLRILEEHLPIASSDSESEAIPLYADVLELCR